MTIVQNKIVENRNGSVPTLEKIIQVASWELKHYSSNRSSWAQSAAAFFLFLILMVVRNQWGYILGTTAVGQLAELAYNLMLIFGIMLPFLVTDRVAHDYQERMHELLMATAVPTHVYVLGRYVTTLLISLCLAIVLLVSQLLVNLILPMVYTNFPAADPVVTLSLWLRLTLPAGILVGSLCFCLGTLFPRITAIPKIAMGIAWIILALDNDPTELMRTGRAYWNPTGAGMITLAYKQFQDSASNRLKNTLGAVQRADLIMCLQQSLPDLRPWIGPFLILAVIGLLLGFLTIISFRRFRSVMNG